MASFCDTERAQWTAVMVRILELGHRIMWYRLHRLHRAYTTLRTCHCDEVKPPSTEWELAIRAAHTNERELYKG